MPWPSLAARLHERAELRPAGRKLHWGRVGAWGRCPGREREAAGASYREASRLCMVLSGGAVFERHRQCRGGDRREPRLCTGAAGEMEFWGEALASVSCCCFLARAAGLSHSSWCVAVASADGQSGRKVQVRTGCVPVTSRRLWLGAQLGRGSSPPRVTSSSAVSGSEVAP